MYCHNCGKPIIANAKFCQSCGMAIESPPEDFIAQHAEVLDLSEEITVNNDAQIVQSAQWSGDESISTAQPTIIEPIKAKLETPILKTHMTSIPTCVIHEEAYDGKIKYQLKNGHGSSLSKYFEFMHEKDGVMIIGQGGKYCVGKLTEGGFVNLTNFIFDKAMHLDWSESNIYPILLRNTYTKNVSAKEIIRVVYNNQRCILLLDENMSLYRIVEEPAQPIAWHAFFLSPLAAFFISLMFVNIFQPDKMDDRITGLSDILNIVPIWLLIVCAVIGLLLALINYEPAKITLAKTDYK